MLPFVITIPMSLTNLFAKHSDNQRKQENSWVMEIPKASKKTMVLARQIGPRYEVTVFVALS